MKTKLKTRGDNIIEFSADLTPRNMIWRSCGPRWVTTPPTTSLFVLIRLGSVSFEQFTKMHFIFICFFQVNRQKPF